MYESKHDSDILEVLVHCFTSFVHLYIQKRLINDELLPSTSLPEAHWWLCYEKDSHLCNDDNMDRHHFVCVHVRLLFSLAKMDLTLPCNTEVISCIPGSGRSQACK